MNAEAFNAYSEVVFRQMYGQRFGIPPTQADYDAASVRYDGNMTDCEIQVGETVTGYIEHNGLMSRTSDDIKVPSDKDWFKVNLTAGTRYKILIETRNAGMNRPDLGGVFDSGGNRVRNGNGSRGNRSYSEYIQFEPTSSGTYYIEAAAGSSSQFNTGRYWLTVNEVP